MRKEKAPQNRCVLVTGGCGFIGSHTVVVLLQAGYEVVVVDDLSNASERVLDRIDRIVGDEAAERLTFVRADVADREALDENTMDLQPWARITSTSASVPPMLLV